MYKTYRKCFTSTILLTDRRSAFPEPWKQCCCLQPQYDLSGLQVSIICSSASSRSPARQSRHVTGKFSIADDYRWIQWFDLVFRGSL